MHERRVGDEESKKSRGGAILLPLTVSSQLGMSWPFEVSDLF